MKCGVILLIYTNLNAGILSFFPQNGNDKPQCFLSISSVLKTLVDHELLQLIACRFFIDIANQCNPDDFIITGDG